jgi:hypothetical protein
VHTSAVVLVVLTACISGIDRDVPLANRHRAPTEQPIAVAAEPITVLLSSQLAAVGTDVSLYNALLRVRPALGRWPSGVGLRAEEQVPTVFVDGLRVGDVTMLYRIPSAQVRKVLILGPQTARQRYGPDVRGGAILVSLLH